ncbi:mobile element-associated protein, partial [Staphylococcus aureus]|nr:mobile element-associated protein [Staphylococcus aureus]
RLMVPLNEPVSAEDYRKYSCILAKYIGYEVDEASFVPSQIMALPVKRDKNASFIFKYNDKPAITYDQLEKIYGLVSKSEKQDLVNNYSNQY